MCVCMCLCFVYTYIGFSLALESNNNPKHVSFFPDLIVLKKTSPCITIIIIRRAALNELSWIIKAGPPGVEGESE